LHHQEGETMSSLTRDDLKTILQFGIHIAKIDGDFAVWEKKVLARYADAMKLTEQERAQMVADKLRLAQGLDSLSSTEANHLLLKTLCSVAHSDGVPHETELDFITKVMQRLGGQIFILSKEEWGIYEKEVIDTINEVVRSGV
jgi:tellurite resistance protein